MDYGKVRCRGIERERRERDARHHAATQNDILIPGLPNEISILCIARVPRSDHLNMSGVSRGSRNVLRGTVLPEMRRKLSLAEERLYFYTGSQNQWRCFDPVLKKWSKLPPMPRDNRMAGHSAFASFNGNLFVIGGYLLSMYSTDKSYIPCSTASYFDTRSYCWKTAANLNIARAECMTGVINDQLYVFGGTLEGGGILDGGPGNTTITAEVYDPTTNSWRFVSNMKSPVTMYGSAVMGGKFYAMDSSTSEGVVYDAHKDTWEDMAEGLSSEWDCKTTVLNGKLYTLGDGFMAGNLDDYGSEITAHKMLRVYNPKKREWPWEMVYDLMWEHTIFMREVELVSLGEKLCVVSVESNGCTDEDGFEVSAIVMAVLEMEDHFDLSEWSEYSMSYSLSFRDEFQIQFEEAERVPRQVKRCQTITL